MDVVRIGVIGLGNMGGFHIDYLTGNEVPGAELKAVCDVDPDQLARAKSLAGDDVSTYGSADELLAEAAIDAVIIATPPLRPSAAGDKGLRPGTARALRKTGRRIHAPGAGNEHGGREERPRLRNDVQPADAGRAPEAQGTRVIGRTGRAAPDELHHHELVPCAELLRLGRLARHLVRRRRRRARQPVPPQPRPLAVDLRHARARPGLLRLREVPTTSKSKTT